MLENSKHAITENEVLMKMARESLKDKWGLATGLTLVVLFIVIVLGAIPIIGQIYLSIISGPIALGLAIFSLSISRNKDARIEQVFKGFNNFVTTLVVYLLMLLFVLFWSILLIIPGIVAACSYSMTYYILADDNSIGAMEAIDKSKKMMYGYKLKYFYLNLRFTGWVILSILTFGIGFLWLYPYIIVSTSKFYDDIKDKQITNEQELEEIKAKKEKIKEYNKVIELNPQDAEAYYDRGNAKAKLEDYRGAISDYNKAIEINPKHAAAYNNRGNAKGNLDDHRGAILDCNKAIELNPKYADAYNNRGIAKYDLDDHRGAISDYNKAIELNPQYADAYYNRGVAKSNLKDTNGAYLDWSKAGELGDMEAYDLIKEYCK